MWFESLYTFLGGLGIFFLGMKSLSESLQALSGQMIRNAIQKLTSNRFLGVGVGMLVTTLVQSSSITTVMTVGLVNANLMALTQAIPVIFGANIGTTITGWIIAIKVGKYGLLLVGLGVFPVLFSKFKRIKSVGTLLIALGFIFMGLEFMSAAFVPLRSSEAFMYLLKYFSADNLPTLLACVGMGMVLTFLVQSSSAMLGVTIALASTGAISFQTAAALVLGENIGTTITALLASVGTSSSAKRAAKAHAIFNMLAVLILVPFFWHYLDLVDWVVAGNPDNTLADGTKPLIATHIAAGHSIFNITATLMFLPFVNQIAKLVTWLTPAPNTREIPHLKYIQTIQDFKAPSLALVLAEKEIHNMAEITARAVDLTKDYITNPKPSPNIAEKINHYENVTDSIQGEITIFLRNVQEASLTPKQAAISYALNRTADELESVADYCASVARAYGRLLQVDEDFSDAAREDIATYTEAVVQYFHEAQTCLDPEEPWDFSLFEREQKRLLQMANDIRDRHKVRLSNNLCSPAASMAFSDIIVGLRKLKGHVFNIAEAMNIDAES